MLITLNISPCPNDTFMFDALLHGRIDTEGVSFESRLMDIEELNAAALNGEAQVTKCSYALYPHIYTHYRLLDSGSALGRGNGPLLVMRKGLSLERIEQGEVNVALPGEHTTAHALLSRLYPQLTTKRFMRFSDVAGVVERGECEVGVLIHEGRFTYGERNLELVADLGVLWEERTGLPLPLGAIAVDRTLPLEIQQRISRVLRRSIAYAFAHPDTSLPFVRAHAQEMEEAVVEAHISLFVNDYSLSLGEEGHRAIEALLHPLYIEPGV